MEPLIKWSGSKRRIAKEIIKYFPKSFKNYHEPFIGGGSMLFALLHSDIVFEKAYCSDICEPLIGIFNAIKLNPKEISTHYRSNWEIFQKNERYFYEVRSRFNKEKDPKDFLFLSRTCYNGLIRFNPKGEFNTAVHLNRPGLHPNKMEKMIGYWNEKIKDTIFECKDFSEVQTKEDDFMFLDPPYFYTNEMYTGEFDFNKFWMWLEKQPKFAMTLGGKRNEKEDSDKVPVHLYNSHRYILSGNSSYSRLKGQSDVYVYESLFIKN